jgi:hypothetical protein
MLLPGGGLFGIVLALCATDGGNAGPITGALGAVPIRPPAPRRADGGSPFSVVVWPARLVILTMFVVLLISTLLWTLTKITLFGGGTT